MNRPNRYRFLNQRYESPEKICDQLEQGPQHQQDDQDCDVIQAGFLLRDFIAAIRTIFKIILNLKRTRRTLNHGHDRLNLICQNAHRTHQGGDPAYYRYQK